MSVEGSVEESAESASSPNVEAPKKFTPAERIEELNDIDKVLCFPPGNALITLLIAVPVHIRPPRICCFCNIRSRECLYNSPHRPRVTEDCVHGSQ